MARKLAGLFATLALVAYFAAWLAKRALPPADGDQLRLEDAWQAGFGVAVVYFLVGLFMATLAIGLMREVMVERRSREAERRFRARAVYDAILGDETGEQSF